jgi:crotonobetainyl-CoA:carnitine CoA-transferase CaiB-like acyl-CoA transferase
VVLDLKREEGRHAVLALARGADALIYNLRPAAMDRLGLGHDAVAAVNPGIVYAGAFGFSQRGPYADRPADDDLIQGMAGIASLSAIAAGEPRYAPLVLADRVVALQLANAVLGALLHRARTGRGQRVDVPMFEGLLELVLGEHLAGLAFRPPEGPFGHARSLSRERRPFRTADGHVCLLLYNDAQWRRFLGCIGRSELMEDARFATYAERMRHVDVVYGFLAETLAARSTEEWLALLAEADVPVARMAAIPDLLEDEHLRAIGYFREMEHPSEGAILGLAVPSEWSDSPPSIRRHAPLLGEHTEEVLREAGLDAAAIARLCKPTEKI